MAYAGYPAAERGARLTYLCRYTYFPLFWSWTFYTSGFIHQRVGRSREFPFPFVWPSHSLPEPHVTPSAGLTGVVHEAHNTGLHVSSVCLPQ